MNGRTRVGVLISGRGSNMASLIEAAKADDYPAEIAVVVSNRPDAPGLDTAKAAGIRTATVDHKKFDDRPAFERALHLVLQDSKVDLICNAGFYGDKHHKLDGGYPAEMWAETFATNVTGVFLTIQALLPNLRAAPGARIAIISSQMASHTRAPGRSFIYCASKAAALNLGRNLAVDLKPEGIAVGIYHPGWVRTDMGGEAGDISAEESASGLAERFDALDADTTGCFQTWDGRDHPF